MRIVMGKVGLLAVPFGHSRPVFPVCLVISPRLLLQSRLRNEPSNAEPGRQRSFAFRLRAHSTQACHAMQVSPAPVAFECPSDSSPTTSLSSTLQNPRRSPVGTGARSPAGSDARNPAHRPSMDVPVLAHSLTASYHTLIKPHNASQPLLTASHTS